MRREEAGMRRKLGSLRYVDIAHVTQLLGRVVAQRQGKEQEQASRVEEVRAVEAKVEGLRSEVRALASSV
eukprot:661232-Rhodomonas_salina.1